MLSDLKLAARYWQGVVKRAARNAASGILSTWGSAAKAITSVVAGGVLGYSATGSPWIAIATAVVGAVAWTLLLFGWSVFLVPARTAADAEQAIARRDDAVLARRSAQSEAASDTGRMERLKTLHNRGLHMRAGTLSASMEEWAMWRQDVYDTLPLEKERFRMIGAALEADGTTLRHERHDIITRELEFLAAAIGRIDEDIRIKRSESTS
jgi:hypothetical protein